MIWRRVTEAGLAGGRGGRVLLDRFPGDDKAPGALLKLGLSQYGLKQYDRAESTLRAVVARHPGTDIARTADDRLRSMATGGR